MSRPEKKIKSIQFASRLGRIVTWEGEPPQKNAWNKHWFELIHCVIEIRRKLQIIGCECDEAGTCLGE